MSFCRWWRLRIIRSTEPRPAGSAASCRAAPRSRQNRDQFEGCQGDGVRRMYGVSSARGRGSATRLSQNLSILRRKRPRLLFESVRSNANQTAVSQHTGVERTLRRNEEKDGEYMDTITFTKSEAPEWLLAMWKEIDDKTFGKGFDCFAENAVCNLGVADWHGRETIRENLRAFIDRGFTANHDVVEYWDSPMLKVFHGKVGMKFDDPNIKPVRPTMCHFFYMDPKDPTKVVRWIGAVGPTGF